MRRVVRWLAVLAITIIVGLVAATPTDADSPNSPPIVHGYDAMTYDQLTGYIGPECGPPVQAPEVAASFGEHPVDRSAHCAPAHPATSENCTYTTYDQLALFAQVGSATTTTASGVETIDGVLSPVRLTCVAAKACSFTGSTVVLMADGSRKPIEDVRVGDKVIATDPETGEQAAKTVEHVFVHDDTVVDLFVDGEVITTTEDHPFWSVTDQRFERADELSGGEKVLSADGRVITVSGLELGTAREALAYNLSVEGIHTYHVGDDEILVHNNCFTSLDALNNPKSFEGLTPSQIDDLARNAGFEVRAGSVSAKNPATRYYLPGTNGSQGFRVLPQGVPGQPGVKSGACLKYFGGPLHGTRVPLGMP